MYFKKLGALIILFVSILFMVGFLGLGKSAKDFYPLQAGRIWDYRLTYLQGTNIVQKANMKTTTMDQRELDGKTVTPMKIEINNNNKNLLNIAFLVSDESGIYSIAMQTENQSEPVMRKPSYYIINPIKAETVKNDFGEEFKIVSINDDVTVFAGTFKNCVKVEKVEKNGQKNYMWYAEDIGEIKRIIERTDKMKIIVQLEKYTKQK